MVRTSSVTSNHSTNHATGQAVRRTKTEPNSEDDGQESLPPQRLSTETPTPLLDSLPESSGGTDEHSWRVPACPPHQSSSREPRVYFKFLSLAPDVTLLNFIAYLFAAFWTVATLTLVNSSQSLYLTNVIGITENKGNISGDLGFYDQLLSIPASAIWGGISDRIGRRIVYPLGFLIIALDLYFWTLARNVYPQVLMARLFFALGSACITSMLTAVLADSAGEGRGNISGLVGLVSGLGALFAVFVLLPIPQWLESSFPRRQAALSSFYITGSLLVVVAIVIFATLKRDNPSIDMKKRRLVARPSLFATRAASEGKNLVTLLREGFAAGIKDYKVALAYINGFAARTNTIVITLFIPLWVNQFFLDEGLCQAPNVDPRNEDEVQDLCRDAFTRTYILTGVTQVAALLAAPFFGVVADKFGWTAESQRRGQKCALVALPTLIACTLATVSYMTLFAWEDPRNNAVLAITILLGIGEIGTVVTGVALASAEFVPEDIRGSVAGVYSLCGAVGILFVTKVGGYLFDEWLREGPFLLAGVLHAFAACVALLGVVMELRERQRPDGVEVPDRR